MQWTSCHVVCYRCMRRAMSPSPGSLLSRSRVRQQPVAAATVTAAQTNIQTTRPHCGACAKRAPHMPAPTHCGAVPRDARSPQPSGTHGRSLRNSKRGGCAGQKRSRPGLVFLGFAFGSGRGPLAPWISSAHPHRLVGRRSRMRSGKPSLLSSRSHFRDRHAETDMDRCAHSQTTGPACPETFDIREGESKALVETNKAVRAKPFEHPFRLTFRVSRPRARARVGCSGCLGPRASPPWPGLLRQRSAHAAPLPAVAGGQGCDAAKVKRGASERTQPLVPCAVGRGVRHKLLVVPPCNSALCCDSTLRNVYCLVHVLLNSVSCD